MAKKKTTMSDIMNSFAKLNDTANSINNVGYEELVPVGQIKLADVNNYASEDTDESIKDLGL